MASAKRLVSLFLVLFLVSAHPTSASATRLDVSLSKPTQLSAVSAASVIAASWRYLGNAQKIIGYEVQVTAGGRIATKKFSKSNTSARMKVLVQGAKHVVSVRAFTRTGHSAFVSRTVATDRVLKKNTIFFEAPRDMFVNAAPQDLAAGSPTGKVFFSSQTPNTCEVVNNQIVPKFSGECRVRATSPATSRYTEARAVVRILTIADPPTQVNRELLWADEFNGTAGSAPNSDYWTADESDGCRSPYNNCGWGNTERQWYLESQNRISAAEPGSLSIDAIKLPGNTGLSCYYGKCEWKSGKITTYNKVAFTYGYMEARIKAPAGGGAWPAFWMLNTNIRTVPWPISGELDIWEYKGNYPSITFGTVHFANNNNQHTYLGATKDTLVDLSADYHRYGMLWKPDEVSFYFDDTLVYSVNKATTGLGYWPFGPNAQGKDPTFYAIFNLAMGGHFGGSIDPQLSSTNMKVDWVRYYSVNGLGKVTVQP